MKKLNLLIISVLTIINTNAQQIQWQKCLGGNNIENAKSIQQTSDGGFIVAGHTSSSSGDVWGFNGGRDFWVVKLNASGDTLWTRSLGGSNYEYANSIQQTSDGGYIIAGEANSNDGDVWGNHGLADFWIIKLNASGDTLWTKCFGGSNIEEANSIQQTSDGGYIVAGEANSNDGDVWGNHGSADAWILRLNASGDTIWTRCLGGTYSDYVHSVQQTSDGGYIVTGKASSNDGDVWGNHGGCQDAWVVKLDASGDTLWTKCLGGNDLDGTVSIQQISDAGYIVAGTTLSVIGDVWGYHGLSDYWIIKLDASGDTLWTRCLGGSGSDLAYSIQQISDGGYISAGMTDSSDDDVWGNNGSRDSWIVKLDVNGDTIWTRCLGGTNIEYAYSIQQTSDGGYIVAGYTESNDGDVLGNDGGTDFWIVKLDANGAIVEDYYNNFNISIYPNPTTGVLRVQAEGIESIEVINIEGKQVYKGKRNEIDLIQEPDGIYIIKVITDKQTKTSKLIKQ